MRGKGKERKSEKEKRVRESKKYKIYVELHSFEKSDRQIGRKTDGQKDRWADRQMGRKMLERDKKDERVKGDDRKRRREMTGGEGLMERD